MHDLPIIQRMLAVVLGTTILLTAAACGVFVFDEPETWDEARDYVMLLGKTTYADIGPAITALEAAEEGLQSANDLLLKEVSDELDCETFNAAWSGNGHGQAVRNALLDQDRVLAEYTGFSSMAAFPPSTVVYAGMREKFDLVKHIVGEELGDRLDEVEGALTTYAGQILDVRAAEGEEIADLAVDDFQLAAKARSLATLLQGHEETLGNLLSEEEREAIDSLFDLISRNSEFEEATLRLRTATTEHLNLLSELGASPAACEEMGRQGLEAELESADLSDLYATATEAARTRHDAIMAARGNAPPYLTR